MNQKIREFIQRSYPQVDLDQEIANRDELPKEVEHLVTLVVEECLKVSGRTPTVWPFAFIDFNKVIRRHFGLD